MTQFVTHNRFGDRFGYRITCHGGPFDDVTLNYPDLPQILVLMTTPFHYHDYRKMGSGNDYQYVEETAA